MRFPREGRVGAIRSIETIKSSGLEEDAFSRWAGYHGKAMGAAQELDRQTAFLGTVPPLLAALGNAAVLGVGTFRVMHGIMSIGELVAFQTLMASFAEPIGRLVAYSHAGVEPRVMGMCPVPAVRSVLERADLLPAGVPQPHTNGTRSGSS